MKNHTQLIIILALAILINPILSNAQRATAPKWEARLGVGILPTFLGQHAKSEMTPMSFEIQYRPEKKYSIGLLIGHSVTSATLVHHTGGKQHFTNRYTLTAVRGAIHFSNFERWDFYGGLILGYSHSDIEYKEEVDKSLDPTLPVAKVRNGLLFSGFMGTSFQIKGRVHVFGELSYGLSILTSGLTYKF